MCCMVFEAGGPWWEAFPGFPGGMYWIQSIQVLEPHVGGVMRIRRSWVIYLCRIYVCVYIYIYTSLSLSLSVHCVCVHNSLPYQSMFPWLFNASWHLHEPASKKGAEPRTTRWTRKSQLRKSSLTLTQRMEGPRVLEKLDCWMRTAVFRTAESQTRWFLLWNKENMS